MEKTSDSLAVVAVLIATAAFSAGFNAPGGYGDTGEANLASKRAFKAFLFLDTVATATSMAAAILLVYGKASRSARSWKSFAWALQLMWVSLVSLMLAFHASLVAVATTMASVRYGFIVVFVCMFALHWRIAMWIGIGPRCRTVWRFVWHRYFHLKGRDGIIQRQYPLVGASVFHFYVFTVINSIAFYCFGRTLGPELAGSTLLGNSPAPAPSPL